MTTYTQAINDAIATRFKEQCKITTTALDEQTKLTAPNTSQANMFWDSDNSEKLHGSIGEILDDEASNGCLRVGAEFQIQRAVRLPDVWVKVTAIPDHDEVEYEIIKGGA